MIEPFTISVPDDELVDLRDRLSKVRWPDEIPDSEWDYGTNRAYLQDLVAYWQEKFDWRERERYLNTFAHYRATVAGFGLHFIHEKGRGPKPLPLLLSHACYSNFYEYHKVIRQLADPASYGGDPEDAFDVVAWAMPGFAYSDKPRERGYAVPRFAEYAYKLMHDVLGYERFGAHGGSWGALTSSRLAYDHPTALAGLHLTQAAPYAHYAGTGLGPDDPPLNDEEQAWVDRCLAFDGPETGYMALLTTKPQSIAYGLMDSPVGLAGWMVEKFRRWSDCGGDLERAMSRDEILTNISIYWFSQTINSAQRLYYEYLHNNWTPERGERIDVPTGILAMSGGIPADATPRPMAERVYRVDRYRVSPKGGHFPALEAPEIIIEELREFFRPLR